MMESPKTPFPDSEMFSAQRPSILQQMTMVKRGSKTLDVVERVRTEEEEPIDDKPNTPIPETEEP